MKLVRAFLMPALGTIVFLTTLVGAPAHASLSRVPTSAPATAAVSGAAFEAQVMVEINDARTRFGLKPVRFFDSCVERMATSWGNHIASTGIFAHRDQHEVLRKCNQSWAGENLIRGTGLSARAIVDAWLNSPSHRAVLLKGRATLAGMAVVIDGQGRQVGVLNVADAH
ncbi:MAG: CAP domain-containing protein [Nocardioides sp.]|uniref:CAP domain-containing protein n=1 Tax=Nocardioides sp. TaxID=35761 RepID=UPI003267EA54